MRTVFLYEVRSEPQLTILWYGIEPGLAWKSFALDTNNLKDCKTNGPKRFLPSVLDQEILPLKLMLCSLLPFLLLTHLVCYCLHLRSALQQRAALSFPASLFFFQVPILTTPILTQIVLPLAARCPASWRRAQGTTLVRRRTLLSASQTVLPFSYPKIVQNCSKLS